MTFAWIFVLTLLSSVFPVSVGSVLLFHRLKYKFYSCLYQFTDGLFERHRWWRSGGPSVVRAQKGTRIQQQRHNGSYCTPKHKHWELPGPSSTLGVSLLKSSANVILSCRKSNAHHDTYFVVIKCRPVQFWLELPA